MISSREHFELGGGKIALDGGSAVFGGPGIFLDHYYLTEFTQASFEWHSEKLVFSRSNCFPARSLSHVPVDSVVIRMAALSHTSL